MVEDVLFLQVVSLVTAEVASACGLVLTHLLHLGPGEERAAALIECAHVLLLTCGEQRLHLLQLVAHLRHLRAGQLQLPPLSRAAQLALGHTLLLRNAREHRKTITRTCTCRLIVRIIE